MKKGIICIIICLIFSISPLTVLSQDINVDQQENTSGLFDRILVMGMVINIIEDNETVTANALYLFYYESGILIDKAGIISGLTEITMTKTPLLFLYKPGPFGMIVYIMGFAEDLTIVEPEKY